MGFNGDLYPTAGASVVMTTKGDMVDYDTERQRLGIGSTGQVLTVASSLPTWATLTTADSVLTTQGDVLYESASGLARLGFGTSGDVLTTKGTGANPVWETVSAGATVTTQSITPTSAQTTTSDSFTDVSNSSLTLANRSGGYALISTVMAIKNSDGDATMGLAINYDSSNQVFAKWICAGGTGEQTQCITAMDSLDGGTVKLQWRVSTGTGTITDDTSFMTSQLFLYEVS